MSALDADSQQAPQRTGGTSVLVKNILWQWAFVFTTFAVAILVPRYMIRTLGPDRYGIWVLAFSLIEYAWVFDLGFSPAVYTMTSRHYIRGEHRQIHEILNTVLFLFLGMGILLIAIVAALLPPLAGFFRIAPELRFDFYALMMMVAVAFANAQSLRSYATALEGFNRFDLLNQVRVPLTIVRSAVMLVLLYQGFSLPVLGAVTVGSQILGNWMNMRQFRLLLPEYRFNIHQASWATLRRLSGFGMTAFVCNTAAIVSQFSAAVLIGRYRTVADTGYYNVVNRLLQQLVQLLDRTGLVAAPKAGELDNDGKKESIARLGVLFNRYTLAVFMPVTIWLVLYGRELIALWISPEVAERTADLMPVMVLATAFALAGQAATRPMLFGMGRITRLTWAMVTEAVATVVLGIVAVRLWGLFGVAVVFSAGMVANRGFVVAWILSREAGAGYVRFMGSIYVLPTVCAIPVAAGAWYMKMTYLQGDGSWLEILTAAALIGLAYYPVAFFVCTRQADRHTAVTFARGRMARLLQRKSA